MSCEGARTERSDEAVRGMSYESKTLFGFPVVITDAVPAGTVVMGPMPTWQDLLRHGSLEAAIEARAKEYAMIKDLDVKE